MKYQVIRNIALVLAGFVAAMQLHADTFTLSNGSQIEGEIKSAIGDQVKISIENGSSTTVDFGDFNQESQDAIAAWKQANPEKADVYTKWDAQPVIVANPLPRIPEQFLEKKFRGNASVELVLDESGQVIHATVKQSTHAELEGPAIEATRNWKFQPAQVDGKAVKSKLRVPFNFEHTPEEKKFQEHLLPWTRI